MRAPDASGSNPDVAPVSEYSVTVVVAMLMSFAVQPKFGNWSLPFMRLALTYPVGAVRPSSPMHACAVPFDATVSAKRGVLDGAILGETGVSSLHAVNSAAAPTRIHV